MRSRDKIGGTAGLADWLFGGVCYLCRGECGNGLLCAPCAADLPRLQRNRCPRCALPTEHGTVCGRCIGNPPQYDGTTAAFAYAFPVDVLTQGLKFRSELALAPLLGHELATEIETATEPRTLRDVDLVVPVPLHTDRLARRGYNQSMEIAREVAVRLGLPLAADICERVRDTPAQIELPWKDRVENVRGAFSCRRAVDARCIAVVDDVMTTGATLAEIAATLKKFGAAKVVNWVVARTLID